MTHKPLSHIMVVFTGVTLLLMNGGPALAGEPVFQSTQDQMVRELTRSPAKYRSFVQTENRRRNIMVMEKKAGSTGYSPKTITVVDNQDVPGLKLKIEFNTNSSQLRPAAYPLLRELGRALTSPALAGQSMLVAGHTDSDGTDEYNLRLSLDRAHAVKAYLVSHFSIPEHRLRIRGYGESMPLKPNSGAAYKQMNRRVEILINN